MIESIKIDIGLVVGDSDDCDFCCPFIRNKEPFKRALVSILMWLTGTDIYIYRNIMYNIHLDMIDHYWPFTNIKAFVS